MDHMDDLMQLGNLKAALKKYNRRKRSRAITFWSTAALAFGIAFVSKLSNVEWLIVFLALGVAWFFEQQAAHQSDADSPCDDGGRAGSRRRE